MPAQAHYRKEPPAAAPEWRARAVAFVRERTWPATPQDATAGRRGFAPQLLAACEDAGLLWFDDRAGLWRLTDAGRKSVDAASTPPKKRNFAWAREYLAKAEAISKPTESEDK